MTNICPSAELVIAVKEGDTMTDMYVRKAYVTNIVDGDTLDAVVDCGYRITTEQRFRLEGVDTPEKGQEGFHEAKQFAINELLGQEVSIKSTKADSFGRYLGTIFYDKGNFNEKLIEFGYAKPYVKGR